MNVLLWHPEHYNVITYPDAPPVFPICIHQEAEQLSRPVTFIDDPTLVAWVVSYCVSSASKQSTCYSKEARIVF